MTVSEENKIIARTVQKAFQGKPDVFRYWDENNNSFVDILSCEDINFEGIKSYSTLGLSDFSIGREENNIPLRVELVGASDFEYFPNILATCAFYIINSKYECSFRTIYTDVIEMYLLESPMRHILFLSPFLWENDLKTITFKKKQVGWLLAVPISEEEKIFIENNGIEALEGLFIENQVNIFDLKRESVI